MRDHIPVVVRGRGRRGRRAGLAGVLWTAAELTVTVGVVLLLLVVHQVWWTNRQALAGARQEVRALERAWAGPGATPGPEPEGDAREESGAREEVVSSAPAGAQPSSSSSADAGPSAGSPTRAAGPVAEPGRDRSYAVLRIPRLGLEVPVAQGVDKKAVLDKGYVGHYPGTAQPGAEGNFALAGHRNTHGEPFRYLNRLGVGDEVTVDVRGRRYTYVVGRVLPETTARDTGVIAPVPRSVVRPEYGYSAPGAYITLTTCTPEYTSTYRLVVWGTLKR
ncbi:class E sortase [Streptomyces sp. NPDC046557]|uniref:class E sortase n=1 Tax=Streptomyces sp. NPDC046557 TaxID=3155372 RepID=UPI00340DDF1F